jgi:hypothetical protein
MRALPIAFYRLRRLIHACDRTEFVLGRERHPELEATRPTGFAGSASMPGTASSLEPFDAALVKRAGRACRVLVSHAPFKQVSHRGDAGMGMQGEAGKRGVRGIEEVEEDERLRT